MKIYDGFTFNDELDLLELRLETLDPLVDVFVLVEMPISFRRREKPRHFSENKSRFERWKSKIRVVSPNEFPLGPHPIIEHYQRRQIKSGLSGVEAGDLVLVGDVDEIPDPLVLEEIRKSPPGHPVTFRQLLYYYHVNTALPIAWDGTVAVPWGIGPAFDAENIRQLRGHFPHVDGGWHFSWLGSTEQINAKLGAIDVQGDLDLYSSNKTMTCPKDGDLGFIEGCRSENKDLFGRDMAISDVPIEPGLRQPQGILSWLERFPHYARTQ